MYNASSFVACKNNAVSPQYTEKAVAGNNNAVNNGDSLTGDQF